MTLKYSEQACQTSLLLKYETPYYSDPFVPTAAMQSGFFVCHPLLIKHQTIKGIPSVYLLVLRMEDDKMSPLSVKQAFLRMGKSMQPQPFDIGLCQLPAGGW